MRRVPGYDTPLKDWVWYLIVPLSMYIALIVTAIMLPTNPALILYFINAVMVALLFIGIRNSWDLLTFLAVERSNNPDEGENNKEKKI